MEIACIGIEHLHVASVVACRPLTRSEPHISFAILIHIRHRHLRQPLLHTDVTEEVTDEIQNDLTDDDKAASAKAQPHRPALNFYEMGMQKGDVLLWKEDPSISVVVDSERRVIYQGEAVSISALSAKLKGYNTKHIAPGKYWTYKDRLLDDIYDETYPFEE